MAKQTLPTNYKDDVLATSMGKKRRYNLIQNDDGTISLEDATEYTQVGDNYGAAQLNATNQAVNESVDQAKIIDSLDDISANTQSGMVAGALAVAELNGKSDIIIIKTSSPVTSVEGTGGTPQTDGSYSPSIPSNYKAIGVVGTFPTGTGSNGVASFAYLNDDGLIYYRINNNRITSASITVNTYILCQHE